MHALSARHPVGKLLRLPLRLIPSDAVVPILTGPARGNKWVVGSAIHGCWLGIYERRKARLFASYIKPGMTVYDIGGHVGFYSLIASRLAGNVFTFEPSPRNLAYLRRHVDLNDVRNVTVIDAAVSDHTGNATFDEHRTSETGRLSSDGRLTVKTVAIDSLNLPKPDIIKMDIEGGESVALRGMRSTLAHKPTLFLATHGEALERDCCAFLISLGYTVEAIAPNEYLAHA